MNIFFLAIRMQNSTSKSQLLKINLCPSTVRDVKYELSLCVCVQVRDLCMHICYLHA